MVDPSSRPCPSGTPSTDDEGTAAARNRTAAERALAEAAARRAELDRKSQELDKRPEHGGRGGLDPVRYDDWEIAGRAVDF